MSFCSECGKELVPNSKFCPHCGILIEKGENHGSDGQVVITKMEIEKKALVTRPLGCFLQLLAIFLVLWVWFNLMVGMNRAAAILICVIAGVLLYIGSQTKDWEM